MDFSARNPAISTANFCAVFFATAHLYPLPGDTDEARALYYRKAVTAGIIFG